MTEPDRHKQICRECSERPQGCWRAVEYGCQQKYRNAERQATENGTCPLNKWKEVRITVATVATGRPPYFAPFRERNERYCKLHGYQYTVRTTCNPDRAPHWERIPLARDLLGDCDYLLLLDSDAFFYDFNTSLKSLIELMGDACVLAPSDRWSKDFVPTVNSPVEAETLSTGVTLWRNCPTAHDILREWNNVTDAMPYYRWTWELDQKAFIEQVWPKHRNDVKLLVGDDALKMTGRDGLFIRHLMRMSTQDRLAEIAFLKFNGNWHPDAVKDRMIFLFSASRFADRLALCEQTWIKDACEVGLSVVTVRMQDTVDAPVRYEQGTLYVPRADIPADWHEIQSLPHQMKEVLRWALQNTDWKWFFKCDDDTYVSIRRFLAYEPKADYIGQRLRPGFGHGGAGYWLSRRAAEVLVERLQCYQYGAKDRQVGDILRSSGFPIRHDSLFEGAGWRRRPEANNRLITSHRLRHRAWWATHNETGLQAPLDAALVIEEPVPPTPLDRRTRIRMERGILPRR